MDTSDPDIQFDDKGFCNNCTEQLAKRPDESHDSAALKRRFDELIETVRSSGRGSDHDCIIGVSGGVDSTYLAYILKAEYGLRPLAVHMDNGWDSSDAVVNIRNLISTLNIDYETVVLDWPEFRDMQLAFLKASVPEADTPTDVAIPEALHSVAERRGIRYILSASNTATEGILPKCWHYNARDKKYFSYICRQFGQGVPSSFGFYDFRRESYFKLVKGIKTLYPLEYLTSSKHNVIDLLKEKLNFKYYGEKHFESWYTRFIQGYYLDEKFGIDYRRATFSSQIMDGQMTREEALTRLTSEKLYKGEGIDEDKRYVASKLEISVEELQRIIELPPRWYRELPNDEKKLTFIYSIYRTLYGRQRSESPSMPLNAAEGTLTRT